MGGTPSPTALVEIKNAKPWEALLGIERHAVHLWCRQKTA